MNPERWRQIRNIFDGALERAPDERPRFLDEVCANDQEVRREVESLLSSLDSAENFMETPAVAKVADAFEAETKQLERGKCFGHYEIIEQIGSGGMGEVYLATDQKLDRQVAVKILNEKFSHKKIAALFSSNQRKPGAVLESVSGRLNKSEPPLPRRF